MKVGIRQQFAKYSWMDIPDGMLEEEQRKLALKEADRVRGGLGLTEEMELEWEGTDFFYPDENGHISHEDGTLLGEWFDV